MGQTRGVFKAPPVPAFFHPFNYCSFDFRRLLLFLVAGAGFEPATSRL